MSKVLQSLWEDVLTRIKTPEARAVLHDQILKPIIASVMELIYPYLLGIMLLWVVMFVCVALILLILVRGSVAGPPLLILGKQ
jgi:hypothetical protein